MKKDFVIQKNYHMLREISDKLCLEYGLSIIKNKKIYKESKSIYLKIIYE